MGNNKMTSIEVRSKVLDLFDEILNEYNNFDYVWKQFFDVDQNFIKTHNIKDLEDLVRMANDPERQATLDKIWSEYIKNDTTFLEWFSKIDSLLNQLNQLPMNSDPDTTRTEIGNMLSFGNSPDMMRCSNEVFSVSIVRNCLRNEIPMARSSNWKIFSQNYANLVPWPSSDSK